MPSSSNSDKLARALAEAGAMRSLAQILAGLPDDDSRSRVLRWCLEHFRSGVSVSVSYSVCSDDRQRPAAPSGGFDADPALTVDDDVFDGPIKKGEAIHCENDVVEIEPEPLQPEPQRPASTGLGLDSLLRDFVCDFQRLALDCQKA